MVQRTLGRAGTERPRSRGREPSSVGRLERYCGAARRNNHGATCHCARNRADCRHPLSSAGDDISNFGTPGYYVLDAAGRIRFDTAEDEATLLAQVGSLRAGRAGR